MQGFMAVIAVALTTLTLAGGLVAGSWLLVGGEIAPVIAGLSFLLLGRFATELAAHPLHELKIRTGADGQRRVLAALAAHVWIFAAMAGWAGCTFLLYFTFGTRASAPLLLWAYAIAVSPWLLFERRHFVRTGRYFLCSTPPSPLLFFELACAASAALLFAAVSPHLVLVTFVAIMSVSLLFECAETAFPASVKEIWVASRAPATVHSSPWAAVGLAIAVAVVFGIDVVTPAGIDDGAGYSPLLILCLWLSGRHTLLITACTMTALAVGAFFLVQASDISTAGTLFNRATSVTSIWVVYVLLSRRSLLATALRAAEARLHTVPQGRS
jgi:hypothetical protein